MDHQELSKLLLKKGIKLVTTLTERWREKISMFDYGVESIRSSDNGIAAGLSRSSESIDMKMYL